MNGIINLYKPKGISSAQAVGKVKKILSRKDVGHMGTLDPEATGVLLIGVGKATRLFDFFLQKDKVYDAEFTFGYETDTLDASGTILRSTDHIPSKSEIDTALKKQIGKIDQLPPKYSAKSINGRRAYDLVREGKEFELKANRVEIFSIDILGNRDEKTYRFRIHCGAGTYIRSICRDLAYSCGSLAAMTALERMRCGNFDIKDSVTLDKLELLGETAVISSQEILRDRDELVLDESLYKRLINGVKIPCDKIGTFTVYCKNEFFGLGQSVNGTLKITTYLRDQTNA